MAPLSPSEYPLRTPIQRLLRQIWRLWRADSQRQCRAGVPPEDLSSCSSRSTFMPVAASSIVAYESHRLCQLADQATTPDRPVDTFGCLLKVEPERSRTFPVDQRNAPRRPTTPLPGGCLAALPSGGDEACQASSPPDGSSGSPSEGHCRPAMAFRTHLKTPHSGSPGPPHAWSLCVRSQPLGERGRGRRAWSSAALDQFDKGRVTRPLRW